MKVTYRDFVDDLDVEAIEDAIGFEVLARQGQEDIGKCPDFWGMHKHGDTTGKFAINREKKVYHCFVCEGGNLLSLAMAFLNCDEEEATDWLYQFAKGDLRTDAEFIFDFKKLLDRYEERAEKMPYFNRHMLDQFENGDGVLEDWCQQRGISEAMMWEAKLGYAPMHKKAAPRKDGAALDEDYIGPCIVFPHFWDNRLVGWQHRWLNHGEDTPIWLGKYTNTSDFPKHETLYNYNRAILKGGEVTIVESVPTVLFLESHGVTAVSPFGSKIRPEQLKLLRKFPLVHLAPDNDKPGREFVQHCIDGLLNYVELQVLPPVEGSASDLGDLAQDPYPHLALRQHYKRAQRHDVLPLRER